jgi:hypothetical protein
MSKLRWFYLCSIVILAVSTGFAVYAAKGNPNVVTYASAQSGVSKTSGDNALTDGQCPFSAGELRSMHIVYIKDINMRMQVTDSGPIGIDGGLTALGQCKQNRKP